MAFNLSESPAWRDAVAKEREIRELAYLGLPTPIAGGLIALPPLTLRHQAVLFAAQNPLVTGTAANVEEALMFLWVLQPEYSPGATSVRDAYVASVLEMGLAWDEVLPEMRAYYAEQTLDAPKGGPPKPNQASAFCGVAVYVKIFARAFGWTRDYILDSPVVCLNQERRILEAEGPRAVVLVRAPKLSPPEGGALSRAAEKAYVIERRAGRTEEGTQNG